MQGLRHLSNSRRCFTSSAKLLKQPAAVARRATAKTSGGQAGSTSRRSKTEERFNYNPNPFDHSDLQDPNLASYPLLTAEELSPFALPPKRVQLLVRDFIDDALYNPNYGYFTQQAVIFDPDQHNPAQEKHDQVPVASGFDFNNIRNSAAFDREVASRYGILEGEQGASALPGKDPASARQVWHTPTELFKVRRNQVALELVT